MDNVVQFPGSTVADLPAEQILEEAKKEEFDSLIIIGTTKDGRLYFASTTSDMATVSFIHKRADVELHKMLAAFD